MGERFVSKELNKILGKEFKVLNDGFVRIVDYMGNDDSIVQAARVSYGKGTKKVHEDRGLIRYLMRHRHTTPFEMCEIKFHVRVPMDCWRQWIRHRTANINEYSTRYSEAINSSQTTKTEEWRSQSTINKQGSEQFLLENIGSDLTDEEINLQELSRTVYEKRLEKGVAREQARKDLPLSTYTEAYWKIDLHNLLHFLSLRMDSHAQWEIRQYANVIGNEIVSLWVPHVWEAFVDYRLNGLFLSESDQILIQTLIEFPEKMTERLKGFRYVLEKGDEVKLGREGQEFHRKIFKLGLTSKMDKVYAELKIPLTFIKELET